MKLLCLAPLALTATLAAQGHVHVVDDGRFDLGAVRMLDLDPDGTLETQVELGALTSGLSGALLEGVAFGGAAAPTGDLDGNGVLDLAVGAPGDDTGGNERGAVWILFRAPGGGVASRRAIRSGENLSGALVDVAGFGTALAHLGDLDGNGDTELAVGAPGSGLGGEVWILSLASDGSVSGERRIGHQLGGFAGSLDADDHFGFALASIGDQDGDGVGDLAVGAEGDDDGGTDSGAVWILHLNADATVKTALKLSRAQGGLGFGLASNDRFGSSLCVSGDVDGDGVLDLAVGARLAGSGEGAVWLLLMKPDGTVRAKKKISRTAGGLSNPTYEHLGSAVAPLGDLNGDGTPDLAVGASQTSAGATFSLFLSPDGTVRAQQLIEGTALGLANGDGFGSALATLGDLDLDGRLDIVVGTNGRDVFDGEFTSLQEGVNAAASGDTLLVRRHRSSYGAAVIEAKSLTLVGESPGSVVESVTVRNLAATQSVCLLRLDGRVELSDDEGLVWIEHCRRVSEPIGPFTNWVLFPGLSVARCASVVVIDSTFEGGVATDPGAGLQVSGPAIVHAYDTTFLGRKGDCSLSWDVLDCWDGGPGVVTDPGATVLLTGCTVRGGNGIYVNWFPYGSDCTDGGPGVNALGPVTVRASLLEGGSSPCSTPGANYVGAVQFLPGESLALSSGPLAREGDDVVLAFRGPPDAAVWLMGSPLARLEERPTQHGTLLLGTPRSIRFMGTTDASGALDVLVPLGLLPPALDVRRTFLQPLMIETARVGPAGKAREGRSHVTLGAGSALVVLDHSF